MLTSWQILLIKLLEWSFFWYTCRGPSGSNIYNEPLLSVFCCGLTKLQVVILYFGLSTAPWVFTKVLVLLLALLLCWGIPVMRYLDDNLLQEQSASTLSAINSTDCPDHLKFQVDHESPENGLGTFQPLAHLCLILHMVLSKVFLTWDKLQLL